jgi:putative hemolysin
MTLEILIVLLLVLLNGLFAMAELAIVSARRARLKHAASQGNKGAAAALDLAEHPGRFLSTVQIGITLIGVLAGAFGGATISEEMAVRVATAYPQLAEYAEGLSIGAVVVSITFLSLILGELVPKRLALNRAFRWPRAAGAISSAWSRSRTCWQASWPGAASICAAR